jgi:trigger factor
VQTEFKQIDPTTKEIVLTVEAEKVDAAYQKYLQKAAKSLEVPGFRKGKAPLSMVTRLHGDRIKDYFEKDYVDEAFSEAAKEHDIRFLLYPEVKELEWQQGSEMKITLQIEHEPPVEFRQIDNLQVPFKPLVLEEEVEKFIQKLSTEHATFQHIDVAETGDLVLGHLSFELNGTAHTVETTFYADDKETEGFPGKIVGASTGDRLEAELDGKNLKLMLPNDHGLDVDEEAKYACSFETSDITRNVVPAIDDEFAKDMDFADLTEMRTKIGEDMKTRIEHVNYDGENSAILAKLYNDNQFPLPKKTLQYLVVQELESFDERYRQMLQKYVIDKVVQDMVSMYLLAALQKQSGTEFSEEMKDAYIEHRAILDEKNPAAYREQNQEMIDGENFREGALNYHILRGIAATCIFVEPEPEPEPEQPEDTEFEVSKETEEEQE